MYTQCGNCMAVHALEPEQLRPARGRVRCGHCGEVFDAIDRIGDSCPPGHTLPLSDGTSPPPVLGERRHDLFSQRWSEPPAELAAEPALDDEVVDAPPPLVDALDQLAGRQPSQSRVWVGLSLLALLALLVQFAWYERGWLLSQPQVEAQLVSICERFGCEVPFPRQPGAVQLVSRDIRPHPSVEGALIITASLRSTSAFTQAYPDIHIRLSDLQGTPVVARTFSPAEYLQDGQRNRSGLKPDALLPVVFEVVDPGEEVVAFEFSFR